MGLFWEDEAWQEYLGWQEQDKKTLRKINKLVKDIQHSPFEGIGHPEPPPGSLSGWWRRRIDEKKHFTFSSLFRRLFLFPSFPCTSPPPTADGARCPV